METHEIVIWSLYIGIVLASFYTYYVKHIVGSFVRLLIEKKAFSKEKSMPLSAGSTWELALIRPSFRKGSSIYDTVAAFEDGEEKKYYIPEKNADKAARKYKGDIAFKYIVITIVAFLIATVVCLHYYNDLKDYLTNFIDGFKE